LDLINANDLNNLETILYSIKMESDGIAADFSLEDSLAKKARDFASLSKNNNDFPIVIMGLKVDNHQYHGCGYLFFLAKLVKFTLNTEYKKIDSTLIIITIF
jgi:hypothetical protein